MSAERPSLIRNLVSRYGLRAGLATGAIAMAGGLGDGIYLHNQAVDADNASLNNLQVCHPIRSSWGHTPEFQLREVNYVAGRGFECLELFQPDRIQARLPNFTERD